MACAEKQKIVVAGSVKRKSAEAEGPAIDNSGDGGSEGGD